jgi:hypothetical protein
LAVEYLFLANYGASEPHELSFEPFNARTALNDYEVSLPLMLLTFDILLLSTTV